MTNTMTRIARRLGFRTARGVQIAYTRNEWYVRRCFANHLDARTINRYCDQLDRSGTLPHDFAAQLTPTQWAALQRSLEGMEAQYSAALDVDLKIAEDHCPPRQASTAQRARERLLTDLATARTLGRPHAAPAAVRAVSAYFRATGHEDMAKAAEMIPS